MSLSIISNLLNDHHVEFRLRKFTKDIHGPHIKNKIPHCYLAVLAGIVKQQQLFPDADVITFYFHKT